MLSKKQIERLDKAFLYWHLQSALFKKYNSETIRWSGYERQYTIEGVRKNGYKWGGSYVQTIDTAVEWALEE